MKNKIWMSFRAAGITPLAVIALLVLINVSVTSAQDRIPKGKTRDSVITAAREIMGQQTYCALITLDSLGKADVRTINPFAPEEDMCVWSATNSLSKKVKEIKNNPNVTLYYCDHKNATGYVAIKGKAVLVDDLAEKMKRKRAYWDQAFPDFKYLMLIKVIPERIEVINYKRGMLNDPKTFEAPYIEIKN